MPQLPVVILIRAVIELKTVNLMPVTRSGKEPEIGQAATGMLLVLLDTGPISLTTKALVHLG